MAGTGTAGKAQPWGPEVTGTLFHAIVSATRRQVGLSETSSPFQLGGVGFYFILMLLRSRYAPPDLSVDRDPGK